MRAKTLKVVSKNKAVQELIKTLFPAALGHIFSNVFLQPVIIPNYNLINALDFSVLMAFIMIGIYAFVLEELFDFRTKDFNLYNKIGIVVGTIAGAYWWPY